MKKLKDQSKMFKELLASCHQTLTSEPENTEVFQLRGLLNNVAEMYDAAIADLNKVITNQPGNENAYFLRSDCHFMKQDFNLAKQDYLRALKLQLSDEKEFIHNHPEEVVKKTSIDHTDELSDMKKVLEYEKARILLTYLPDVLD